MLETHAKELGALVRQKEVRHNPDLKVIVVKGKAKTDHQVIIEATKALIDSMMDDHSSYEYLDNEQHRRERLGVNRMRFF